MNPCRVVRYTYQDRSARVDDIDFVALAKELGKELPVALKPLLEPAAKDVTPELRAFGVVIAKDIALAVKNGDEELEDELEDQVKALLEILRIKAEPHVIAAVGVTLGVVFRVLRIGLKLGTGV